MLLILNGGNTSLGYGSESMLDGYHDPDYEIYKV
jgi:hypothetical protein